MLTGSIYGWENGRDDIFNPLSKRNRDNCLEPMRALKKACIDQKIELHTADVNESNDVKPDFTLYVESVDFVDVSAKKNYLILYETPLTVPRNADYSYLNKFDGIFTWNKDYLENGFSDGEGRVIFANRFIEILLPNPIPPECNADFNSPAFAQREDFICLIGSNRHANLYDDRELYSERVKAVRWFEKHAPGKLKLYGNGWRVPQKRLSRLGKMRYRLEKIYPWLMSRPVFPSYQGPAESKYQVLTKTKYCICFENAKNISGYLTEKIFDCLFAGCVPIYLGDANVADVIPSSCFIDFQEFCDYRSLYAYISNLSPEKFASYQKAAVQFLNSTSFTPFRSEYFAKCIVDRLIS
jgi:hypothetical protein